MNRPSLVITGAVVGFVGLFGYREISSSSPSLIVVPSPTSGAQPSVSPTTTSAAPPPPHSTTTTPVTRNRTTPIPTTTGPTSTTAPTTTTTTAPTTTTPSVRTATGQSENYSYGVISVKVTASGSKISKVTVASINDGGNYRSESIDQAAIPQLEQQALSAQSANIQGVSGASYTSAGFRLSLQSALSRLGI